LESDLDQRDGRGRIGVEFRIGITGHRILADPAGAAADVGIALERILANQSVRGTEATPVGLTIVSALAEGADRIIVEQARAIGPFRLEAVLPMVPDQYRHDFKTPESRDAFNALLAAAATVTIVGDTETRDLTYLLAGRAIVERSDVMIALWDGKPPRGSAGTAAIVAYARARRTPLFWIQVDGTNRITADWGDGQTISPLRPVPMSAPAFDELDRFNRSRIATASKPLAGNLLPKWLDDATLMTGLPHDRLPSGSGRQSSSEPRASIYRRTRPLIPKRT
jgi:hypothetical protein